jgi:RimJ/RimL family protein N-acetyltransferase
MPTTERLVLRRWLVSDREALAAINADPEVMAGAVLGRGLSDDLMDRFEREWRERGFGLWAVEAREAQEAPGVIGFCGLTVPMFLPAGGLRTAEVGWRFARLAWGRGYATEAARAAVDFGFAACGLQEILAVIDPANARSLRVAEKVGMTPRPDRVHPGRRTRVRVFGIRLH